MELAGLAFQVRPGAQEAGYDPESPEAMQRELQRLRKELARVTSQREILKKTLGIVSEV